MAVKAQASVTLTSVVDVDSVQRYYKLQPAGQAKPSKPTAKPPTGWTTTEPDYTEGSTNILYFCDLTVFSDGTYTYSDVSPSSSYEAAKAAYNKANNVQVALNGLTLVKEGTVYIDGGMVYVDEAFVNSVFARDITATGSITGAELIGATLKGEGIDIAATNGDAAGLSIRTEYDPELMQYVLTISGGSLHNFGKLVVGSFGAKLTGTMVEIGSDNLVDSNYSTENYTSFDSSAFSGTVHVEKKFGVCYIVYNLTKKGSTTTWTQILSNDKVPAPASHIQIYQTTPCLNDASALPLDVTVYPYAGGLLIMGGTINKNYRGSFSYLL